MRVQWIDAQKRIKSHFTWGNWEADEFTQIGVHIKQLSDCSFKMDQQESVKSIDKIEVPPDRRKLPDSAEPSYGDQNSQDHCIRHTPACF